MPIVIPVSPEAVLEQGDILSGIAVTWTKPDGITAHVDRQVPFVLVLSRPCNACRDRFISVAPVSVYALDLTAGPARQKPENRTLDWMRRKLLMVAEGGTFREEFYLGRLTAGRERYAARLNQPTTIEVPTEPEERKAFILARRVVRLSRDFVHDLHFRQFASLARLGFDDHDWFDDEDLEVMITAGRGELADLERMIVDAAQAIQTIEAAAGKQVPPKQHEALDKMKAEAKDLRDRLQPYIDVQTRRSGAGG